MARSDRIVVELSNQDRNVLSDIRDALRKHRQLSPEEAEKRRQIFQRYFVGDRNYPYASGDVLVLGPELFIHNDGRVMSYKGQEYYKPCGEFVRELPEGGSSFCVKIEDHQRPNEHEDISGFITTGFAGNTTEENPS